MKKTTGNVRTAVTTMPDQDSSEVAPQSVSEEPVQEPSAEENVPAMPFDLSQVDPEKLQMAEDLGIPVRQIISWAISVEERFRSIEEGVPEVVERAMNRAVERARERHARAIQQRIPQGGGQGQPQGGRQLGLGDILNVIGGSGGGSADEEMLGLTKEMMKLNIESMKADLGFTRAIKNAMVTRIAGEAVKDIVPKG